MGIERRVAKPLLPIEAVLGIPGRLLQLESLVRCKWVCKQWQVLIQNFHFISKHNKRSPFQFTFSWDFRKLKLATAFCSLLQERSPVSRKCQIRNPAVHRVLQLPDPDPRGDVVVMRFGFSLSIYKELKLVSVFNGEEVDGAYKIPALEADDLTWRTLTTPLMPKNGTKFFRLPHLTYWDVSNFIWVVKAGCFFHNTLPQQVFSGFWHCSFCLTAAFWEGRRLCFVEIGKRGLTVLVLED